MTAYNDIDILIQHRFPTVAAGLVPPIKSTLVYSALELLDVDEAAAAIPDKGDAELAVDVVVYRHLEREASLQFDFTADGGSFSRSQSFAQIRTMRAMAEDRAVTAGVLADDSPMVEVTRPVVETSTSTEWVNVN
jgi:hypothetical protein